MSRGQNRRHFLKTGAAVGAGFWVAGGLRADESTSPNETIRFAAIGVGGKGSSDSADAGRSGDMVAICDIDEQNLGRAAARWPDARKYHDFRKLFDDLADEIDAVTISTPDHTHATPASIAMVNGIHCFIQKPLTRTIHEARHLTKLARDNNVATQMGNQGTASGGLRQAAALLKDGRLGRVTELHVWTNRPVWPQGISSEEIPTSDPPEHVHWDEFLGPAKERPFSAAYHPFRWRGWWDFGTGALGDMACHTLNMPFMGLDLVDPTSVQAETSGHNRESFPRWSEIVYEFPEHNGREALRMVWYDGGRRPDPALIGRDEVAGSGVIVVGEKGKLYSPGDYAANFELIGIEREEAIEGLEFPGSPGHFQEFVRMIREGTPAVSNVPDYAGPLTETVLLGNLAVWFDGEKIEWDAENLTSSNKPEVEELVRGQYREGWEMVG